jgi:hypothetical protein
MTEETTARTTREALVLLWGRLRTFLPLLLAALPVYGLHHLGGPLLALPFLVVGVGAFVWWQRRTAGRLAAPGPRP